jgi:hypothetical protein
MRNLNSRFVYRVRIHAAKRSRPWYSEFFRGNYRLSSRATISALH